MKGRETKGDEGGGTSPKLHFASPKKSPVETGPFAKNALSALLEVRLLSGR